MKCIILLLFERQNELAGALNLLGQVLWELESRAKLPLLEKVATYFGTFINIHQTITFFTKDEPTLRRHTHPKSIVYLRVHDGGERSVGLHKCMTFIHHYNI